MVKDQLADGVVSAGNTGALMAISKFVLGTLNGIDRPAIASFLPNSKAHLVCLIWCKYWIQPRKFISICNYGLMFVHNQFSKDKPSVGLLNIEVKKLKETKHSLAVDYLSNSNLNFYGNVEGDDIFQ